jgi:hypothetical protein
MGRHLRRVATFQENVCKMAACLSADDFSDFLGEPFIDS